MNENNPLLSRLLSEHQELQFTDFSRNTAFSIGMKLKEEAERKGKAVTIDIRMNGHQLFHFAMEGTSVDNDCWIARKNNVANHFGKSSFYIKNLLLENRQTIEEMFFLNPMEYSAFGGSFPIIIENCGPVGTITVSGLPDNEDHELVTSVISDFLS